MTLALASSSPATQARHAHDSLVLGVVTAGTRRIDTKGAQTLVPAKAVFVLAPGQAHACAPQDAEDCSYLAVSIIAQALPPELALWAASCRNVPTSPRIDDAELAELLLRLAEAVDRPSGPLERQSLLAECLERLAGHVCDGWEAAKTAPQTGGDRMTEAVQAARQRLEETLEEGVDLASLAAACGLGMYALHRAFTRLVGLPPHAFQTHLRLRRAKELLRAGASLAEAALESGFCDQSHMNRHFARLVGQTPAQYAGAFAPKRP